MRRRLPTQKNSFLPSGKKIRDSILKPVHGISGRLKQPIAWLVVLMAFLGSYQAMAQSVPFYSFTQSTGTYTALTSPTVLAASTTTDDFPTDDQIYTVPLPFNFTFNGVNYTAGQNFRISTNGFVTFPIAAPANTYLTPISGTTVYQGAISALGGDLGGSMGASNLGELSYQTIGTAPNQTFIIQWKNYFRYTASLSDLMNFQIRLNETTNVVELSYGNFTLAGTTATTYQVGLRGANNTKFNNRTTTTNWSATTAGTANTATMTLSSSVKPASGLKYTFTPTTDPNNDLGVTYIYSQARIPAGNPHVVKAIITNTGAAATTSRNVTLTVSGANSFTDAQTVPALAVGATTTVTFASFTSTNTGTNTLTVSIPADDISSNNSLPFSQEVNTGTFGYVSSPVTTLASIGSTGTITLGTRFSTAAPRSVTSLNVYISAVQTTAPASTVTARIYDASGNLLASSAALSVTTTGLKSIPLTAPITISAGDFIAGATVTANTRIGFQPESPTRTGVFYQVNSGPALVDLASSNFGKAYIEAVTTTPPTNDLAVINVYSFGQLPKNFASPHVVQARIANYSATTQTNVPVTLTVSGANTVTLTENVTLPAGVITTVSFSPGLTLNNLGSSTLTVEVPNDDVLSNNSATYIQNISNNRISYIEDGVAFNTGGFGVGLAGGFLAAKYTLTNPTNTAIASVTPTFVATTTSSTYQIVVWDATGTNGTPGTILYTSPTQNRPVGANSPTIPLPNVEIPANGIFYIGIKELDNNVVLGYQVENPLRSGTFYFKGSGGWTDMNTTTILARMALEASIITIPTCAVPFGVSVSNKAIGTTSNSGTATINWNSQTSAANGYNVRYRQLNTTTWTTVAVAGATSNSTVLTGLPVGVDYEVQVEASCGISNNSGFSTSVNFSLPGLALKYNVTRSTSQTFNSIFSSGSPFTWTTNAGTNATLNTDENISEPLNLSTLGFNFFYQGSKMSALRASINGFITFNTQYASKFTDANNLARTDITQIIAPFWTDLVIQGDPAATNGAAGLALLNSSSAPIKYDINGSPGSQTLTIEWSEMETFGNSGPSLTYQVILYEGSNKIEFHYGNMYGFNGTTNFTYAYTAGINGSTISSPTVSGEVLSQQVPNANNFSFTSVNTLNWVPECNSKITFTPATNPVLQSDAIAAITNQVCSNATALTVGTGVTNDFCTVYRSGLNPAESDGTITTACSPAVTGDADDDVWFTFTTTQTTDNVVIVNGSGGFNPIAEVYSGTCGALTAVKCANATSTGLTETITNTSLPAGTYYVRVYDSFTGAPASSGTFTISTYSTVSPPANDNCNTLVAYQLTSNATCTSTASGNTANATASGQTTVCSGSTPDDDVWYTFVPTSSANRIEVTGNSGYNPAIQIYSGTCASLSSLGCFNSTGTGGTESINATLTVGARYYFRIYHAPSGSTPTSGFSICVSTPAPNCPTLGVPNNGTTTVNPAVANTFSWTAPSGLAASSYDLIISTNSNLSSPLLTQNVTSPTVSFQVPANTFASSTIYYWTVKAKNVNGSSAGCTTRTFTTTGTVPSCVSSTSPASGTVNAPLNQTISWTSGGGTPTGFDLYFSTNQALVSAKDASVKVLSNTTAVSYSPSLTDNTTYYWMAIPKNAQGDAAGCNVSSFTTLNIPNNDNCTGATLLALSTPLSTTSVNATQSAAGCTGNADDDVWFKFTTNASQRNYTISVAGNGSYNPVIQLYGTSCASASVACVNTSSSTSESYAVTNLGVNTTYYFRVYSFASGSGTFSVTVAPTPVNNLVVTTNQNVSGTYDNITIAGGVATVTGALSAAQTLIVKNGATLVAGTNTISGNIFIVEAGGTLKIGSPQGIGVSGSTTGNIRFTSSTYNTGGSYEYNGTLAQVTGSGLPATVLNLTVNNTSGITLTNPLSISRMLTLTRGNLNLSGKALILLSTASGTAMVVNTNGSVVGTATMQRYASKNATTPAGFSYHHYSSPVTAAPFSQFADATFTPVVNPAYNTAADPGNVTPFPNIFGFQESRLATRDTLADDSGFTGAYFSPSSLTSTMIPGRGYSVLKNRSTVSLSGTLNNGAVSVGALTYSGATIGGNTGWHLLGNPYPSPIDWDLVTRPTGMDNAVYVYQSTSRFYGTYRAYVPGAPASANTLTNGVIPAMQGFFVRVSQAVPSFSFQNAARLTTYDNPAFYRTTAEERPVVELELANAEGNADALMVYAQSGATINADGQYDAYKMVSAEVPNIYAITPAKQNLAINGIPALTEETIIPLGIYVNKAGEYSLEAKQLLNIPAGGQVYLEDRLNGTTQALTVDSKVNVTLKAGYSDNRFALRLSPANKVMANALQQVNVYPNPTSKEKGFTLELVALKGKVVTMQLFNSVGQVMITKTVTPDLNYDTVTFDTQKLAKGIYTLRLSDANETVSKKVVVQ